MNRLDAFDARIDSSSLFMDYSVTHPGNLEQSVKSGGGVYSGLDSSCSFLMIRVLPTSVDSMTQPGTANIPTVLKLDSTESIPGFSPSYLGLVAGGELDVLKDTSMLVSQWTCLPELKGTIGSVYHVVCLMLFPLSSFLEGVYGRILRQFVEYTLSSTFLNLPRCLVQQ